MIKVPELNFHQKMVLKRTSAHVATTIVRWLFLIAFGFIVLYPLLFMLAKSFSAPQDFSDPTVVWIPKHFSIVSFQTAATVLQYGKAIWNTLRLEVVSAALEVFSCAMIAYGLSRFKFRGKGVLMAFLFLTILVPVQMIVVPNAINFRYPDLFGIGKMVAGLMHTTYNPPFNLLDTAWAFYIPSILGVGLRSGIILFIYIQFFKGLPKELEEASYIDGAGPYKTFFSVIIPSSGVVILTNSIFALIWHWNDYLLAIMYTKNNFPISVALANFTATYKAMFSGDTTQASATMAGCLLTIIPVLVIYLVLQRQFIQSVDRVGIVG